jgi:hypothetical protein
VTQFLTPFHSTLLTPRRDFPGLARSPRNFGQTPRYIRFVFRISLFARLQNGQRRGFGMPRQFLYSRYSYPVGMMPGCSAGMESRKLQCVQGRLVCFRPQATNKASQLLRRSTVLPAHRSYSSAEETRAIAPQSRLAPQLISACSALVGADSMTNLPKTQAEVSALAIRTHAWLDSMFRQDVKLLELVQSLPELTFAQTVADPPSHHLMHRFADLSRWFVLLREPTGLGCPGPSREILADPPGGTVEPRGNQCVI